MDMLSDVALPKHPTNILEQKIEESNAVSVEQVTEVSCLCHSNYQSEFNKIPCTWILIAVVVNNRNQQSRVKEKRCYV